MDRTPLENWIMQKTGIRERDIKVLEAYQLGKLKETISYAKRNSIFYGKRLKDIQEDSILSLDGFKGVPFTLPQDLCLNPLDFLCVPQRKVARIVTLNTSGTSGETKRLYFTEEDLNLTVDFFRHGMSCLTDKTDKVLVLLPSSAYGSIGDLLKKALALSDIECIVHGILTDPEEAANCIEERGITCIVGIPMQVLYLSRVKSGVFGRNIRKVLLSTDYVPEAMINELTRKFSCRVFNHYGMTEMGYGGGVECEALNGYHMRDGDIYFEIIDPITGEPVEKERYGEIVFTTLTRKAMPLIRYRTGDIASFSGTACACGTFLNTMRKVLGRLENRVCLEENRFLYLRELDEIILPFEEILDYKVHLEDKGKIVLKLTTTDDAAFMRIKDRVLKEIRGLLSHKATVELNMTVVSDAEHIPAGVKNSMIKRKIIDCRKER